MKVFVFYSYIFGIYLKDIYWIFAKKQNCFGRKKFKLKTTESNTHNLKLKTHTHEHKHILHT